MKSRITEPQFLVSYILVTTLFFMWGLSYGLLDVLNKHFQTALHLTKAQSGFLQTAYFGAYFVIAIPAGIFINKKGYKAGIIMGLSLYAIGALMFIPSSMIMTYEFFLLSLFILALGLGFLETAANPYSAALGSTDNSERRLNLSQSFNGLGQFVGPMLGGLFFFNEVTNEEVKIGFDPVTLVYVGIACVVIFLIIVFARTPMPDLRENESELDKLNAQHNTSSMWRHKEFSYGVATLFFYVAAQVSVGAFFINLALETWPSLTQKAAAFYLSIAFILFMAGRFFGTGLMIKFSPSILLFVYAIVNVILCILIIAGIEYVSLFAALLMFFFMSIMFPTIFSMGVKNLGSKTKIGSSFMIMAIVGGAILPYFMGRVADEYNTHVSYVLPLICFLIVAIYGFFYKKLVNKNLND